MSLCLHSLRYLNSSKSGKIFLLGHGKSRRRRADEPNIETRCLSPTCSLQSQANRADNHHTIVTLKTHNFPTSSLHPNRTASFKNSSRFSKYFSSATLDPASPPASRPSSCSHASSDHTSLPLVTAPVSSIRSPTWEKNKPC